MVASDTKRGGLWLATARRRSGARVSSLLALSAALVVPMLATVNCADSSTRSRNRLRALRSERTQIIDGLYEAYGGGDIAQAADGEAGERHSALGRARAMVAGAVRELDRNLFEAYVKQVGEGERPSTFSTGAQEFFSRDSVKRSARRFVEAGDEIASVERELELRARK